MFWGLPPGTMRLYYIGAVLPVLCYAAICWSTVTQGELDGLPRIQRRALLLITGAMETTPTSALEVESQIAPFDLYIQNQLRTPFFGYKNTGNTSASWHGYNPTAQCG